MSINRFAVVDQNTNEVIKDGFKTREQAHAFINRQENYGYFNYSVEPAAWNVYDDTACEH